MEDKLSCKMHKSYLLTTRLRWLSHIALVSLQDSACPMVWVRTMLEVLSTSTMVRPRYRRWRLILIMWIITWWTKMILLHQRMNLYIHLACAVLLKHMSWVVHIVWCALAQSLLAKVVHLLMRMANLLDFINIQRLKQEMLEAVGTIKMMVLVW